MIFELIVGIAIGSLALISDAAHNLSDSLSLVIAWLGNRISKKPADSKRTFGYGRAGILTALVNSSILIGIALFIIAEAYQRFMHPEPVAGGVIAIVAGVGIIVNGAVALLFLKDRHDLNVKAAFLNMAFDAFVSFGAVIAGILIVFTKQYWIDPLVGLMIALALIYAAVGIVKEATRILLEGVPKGLKIDEIRQSIVDTSGVSGVDDLHVWALSSNEVALSCHIVPEKHTLKEIEELNKQLKKELKEKFGISHATIEAELENCHEDKETHD